MGKKKYDWEVIKTEYVTSDISLRELAKKYKTGTTEMYDHSRSEGWVEARKAYKANIVEKAVQKSCNKRAHELTGLLDASYKIRDIILDAVNDPEQFNRYLVTKGSFRGDVETIETIFSKVDTRAIKEMSQALRAVEGLIRSLNNTPTEAERQRLQIERERFEFEKEKWKKEKEEASSTHEVRVVFDTDDLEGWTD